MTDRIEEDEMTVDDEKSTEETTEADAADVELEATANDVGDDVEAHIWRAQS